MLRLIFALLCLALPLLARAADPMSEPAPLAPRSLLLDVVRAGDRLVAVGDRGHVLVSTDQGNSWNQRITPTRTMLTGVAFADALNGWAVGHAGVIIATQDGGITWQRQDNGRDLDTIFLDVCFLDARRGFAVGAYGRVSATRDGGQTWQERRISEEDLHLNRITRSSDGTLYVVGEAGLVLVSRDDGNTWTQAELDYQGSLFATVTGADGRVVIAGLRSRIFVSDDHGATWTERTPGAGANLATGTTLPDGTVVFAGNAGHFYLGRIDGETFTHFKPADFGNSVAEIIPIADRTLLTVGEIGAVIVKLP